MNEYKPNTNQTRTIRELFGSLNNNTSQKKGTRKTKKKTKLRPERTGQSKFPPIRYRPWRPDLLPKKKPLPTFSQNFLSNQHLTLVPFILPNPLEPCHTPAPPPFPLPHLLPPPAPSTPPLPFLPPHLFPPPAPHPHPHPHPLLRPLFWLKRWCLTMDLKELKMVDLLGLEDDDGGGLGG